MDIFEEMGRDEVMQQIRRAQHCMDEAVMAVRLLLSTQERDDLLHRNKANRDAAIKRLTTIVESASAAQVDTVLFVEKLRLFKSMCDSIVSELRVGAGGRGSRRAGGAGRHVLAMAAPARLLVFTHTSAHVVCGLPLVACGSWVGGVQDSYPEASSVLHKMFRAHHHLFDVYRHGRWIRLHPSTSTKAPAPSSPASSLQRMHTDVSNLSVMGNTTDSDSDSDSDGNSGRGGSEERQRGLSADGGKLGGVVTDS